MQRASALSTSEAPNVSCQDDRNSTVVRVRSPPGKNMLMALTGVFSYLDLQVISASIKTAESGEVTDEFIVQTSDGGKVLNCVTRAPRNPNPHDGAISSCTVPSAGS